MTCSWNPSPLALALMLSMSTFQPLHCQEMVRSTYTYKTVGDLRIRADVYRKPDDMVRPAILWIHGGALIMGNRRGLNAAQAERYLNAGYTIISIDGAAQRWGCG
jgi:acetyl esterase/lipase